MQLHCNCCFDLEPSQYTSYHPETKKLLKKIEQKEKHKFKGHLILMATGN